MSLARDISTTMPVSGSSTTWPRIAALNDSGRPVCDLEMLSEGERRQLLVGWNQTRVEFPREVAVHELFAEQAARTLVVGYHRTHMVPERATVVHLAQVRQLVRHHVVDHRQREVDQPPVQPDRTVAAGAAPARGGRTQAQSLDAHVELRRVVRAALLEHAPRLALQPALHGLAQLLGRGVVRQADAQHPMRHAGETRRAADAAADVVGEGAVDREGELSVASEDFSFMLQACPGAFIFLGNGDGEGACQVHNPNYDFNDAILPIGASWFARLVELGLPRRG